MSTQYETQGYTINNAGRRLVVDPITRIEGHMRCEVNINDQNVITNAVSCGTMFRGLEKPNISQAMRINRHEHSVRNSGIHHQ